MCQWSQKRDQNNSKTFVFSVSIMVLYFQLEKRQLHLWLTSHKIQDSHQQVESYICSQSIQYNKNRISNFKRPLAMIAFRISKKSDTEAASRGVMKEKVLLESVVAGAN